MSIQPISDIILDVANAADPAKVAAVKQRLAEAAGGDFAALLGSGVPASSSTELTKWSGPARAQFFSAPTGARVIERDWPGHVAQKEFAVRAAAHEWVLCVDAEATGCANFSIARSQPSRFEKRCFSNRFRAR